MKCSVERSVFHMNVTWNEIFTKYGFENVGIVECHSVSQL